MGAQKEIWRINGLSELETNTYHFITLFWRKQPAHWASLDLKSVKYLSLYDQPQLKGNQCPVLQLGEG